MPNSSPPPLRLEHPITFTSSSDHLSRSRGGAAADDLGRNRAQGGPDEEDGDGEGAGHLDDLERCFPLRACVVSCTRFVPSFGRFPWPVLAIYVLALYRPVLNLDLITSRAKGCALREPRSSLPWTEDRQDRAVSASYV